ncbi:SDR family NAD(P)-dependent oxidoreductase [Nocardia sp. NPDC050378]|uniref:SDR family NAD(P)-dependent oxidoreductase n=1 Tax=Nocardia sp. NPDC050378 TaxID=3155400 RepID=UPI0033F8327A
MITDLDRVLVECLPNRREMQPFANGLKIGLEGRPVVVVGAGPGIGEATARAFVAAGCTTYVADIDLAVAKETAGALGALAEAVHVDVLSRDSVREMLSQVLDRSGPPAAVVNVVGIARGKPFSKVTDDDWDTMFNLNLRQQYIVAQEAVRLLGTGGSYIAIASLNGVHSSPDNLPYGAAKAGLVSLVRSLGAELASIDVRVNAVAPGIVETPRMRELFETTGRRAEFAEAVPMKRLGTPDDIAGAAVFLASPLSSYITGQVIVVDGGASVKYPLALLTDAH